MALRYRPEVKWTEGLPGGSTKRLLIGNEGGKVWSISHLADGTVSFAHVNDRVPVFMTWKAVPGGKVVLSQPFEGVGQEVAAKRFLRLMLPALRGLPVPQRQEYGRMLSQLRKHPPKPMQAGAQPLAQAPHGAATAKQIRFGAQPLAQAPHGAATAKQIRLSALPPKHGSPGAHQLKPILRRK